MPLRVWPAWCYCKKRRHEKEKNLYKNVFLRQTYYCICSTGVIQLVLPAPCKYYLIQQLKTWSDARAYCQANHDDLAIIKSDDNLIRFQSEASRQQLTSSAWIGLYNDINSWHWSLGNELVGNMTMWAIHWNQPNGEGNEVCGGIDKWGWLDAPCDYLLPVVCFDGEEQHCCHFMCLNYL